MKPKLYFLLFLMTSTCFSQVPEVTKPNIVIILADDLGAESIGCNGGVSYEITNPSRVIGRVHTPNLDAMAKAGMNFAHCFATPVCSPARAELLTGKYNFRTGFIDIAGRNGATSSLDAKANPTIAMQLKTCGYVTAVVGKWHIGPPDDMLKIPKSADIDTKYSHPKECGFDRQCIFGGAHLDDYGEPKTGAYNPDILQKWAMNFLESCKGNAKPFFLYYAMPFPHTPVLPTPDHPNGPIVKMRANHLGPRGSFLNFSNVVEYLDKQTGEIIKKLKDLGLSENTIVIFTGDNGTNTRITTVMSDGRTIQGGKTTMKETGSWVPLIVNWPGKIKHGSVNDNLVDFTDILPTCLEIAGVKITNNIDGVSFAPQLFDKPATPRNWVHSLYIDKYFVREVKWKMDEIGQLYDLSDVPYSEKIVYPESDTPESKTARERLQAVIKKLHPKDL